MELKEINNTNRKQINNILANNYKKEIKKISRRPSGLRKTTLSYNSLAHKTTWLSCIVYLF